MNASVSNPVKESAVATAAVDAGQKMPGPPVVAVASPVAEKEALAQGLLGCIQTALEAADWAHSTTQTVTQINRQLECLRVSLGWVVSGQLRIVAMSDGVVVEEGAAIPELNQAMLEAVHQGSLLALPQALPTAEKITLAHQALLKTQGLAGVMTVPLAFHGKIYGAITCERSAPSDVLYLSMRQESLKGHFSENEQKWLTAVAEGLAPLLNLQYMLHRPWYERINAWARQLLRRLQDPTERVLRGTSVALVVLLLYLLFWPAGNSISASAKLEGSVQRVLSAPLDGYLRNVHVRPGDVVKQGQILAELSDDDIQSSRLVIAAEINQHENAFAEAFARGDRGQVAMAQSKIVESKAQLELLDQQLARSRLTAPFDGVVIAGDLHQQLGAPVKRGDSLLTLAPGLDWRVILQVSESYVQDIKRGQTAHLRLAAMPGQVIPLAIERVTPIARNTGEGVRYEVEARPKGVGAGLAGLRPGLEGVARIDLPDQPLVWRWVTRSWNWLRMVWWVWF